MASPLSPAALPITAGVPCVRDDPSWQVAELAPASSGLRHPLLCAIRNEGRQRFEASCCSPIPRLLHNAAIILQPPSGYLRALHWPPGSPGWVNCTGAGLIQQQPGNPVTQTCGPAEDQQARRAATTSLAPSRCCLRQKTLPRHAHQQPFTPGAAFSPRPRALAPELPPFPRAIPVAQGVRPPTATAGTGSHVPPNPFPPRAPPPKKWLDSCPQTSVPCDHP